MSIETRPQPRFRMWDKVAYKYSARQVAYTVFGINWDECNQDYEYSLMGPEQKLGLLPEEYIYGLDQDDALYLVERHGMEERQTSARPEPVQARTGDSDGHCNRTARPSTNEIIEALANIERKLQEGTQLSRELAEVSRQLGHTEAELKQLREKNDRQREMIRLFGTLCASRKEGE